MRSVPIVVLALTLLQGASVAGESPDLANEEQRLGYSIGYQVGGDFRRQGLELEVELLVQGVVDALSGSGPRLGPAEMRAALAELRKRSDAGAGGETSDPEAP